MLLVCIVPNAQFFLQLFNNLSQPSQTRASDRIGHLQGDADDFRNHTAIDVAASSVNPGSSMTYFPTRDTGAVRSYDDKNLYYSTWSLFPDRFEWLCQSKGQDVISTAIIRRTFFIDWSLDEDQLKFLSSKDRANSECVSFDVEIGSFIHALSALCGRYTAAGIRMTLTFNDIPHFCFESSFDTLKSTCTLRLAEASLDNLAIDREAHLPPVTGQVGLDEEQFRINVGTVRYVTISHIILFRSRS